MPIGYAKIDLSGHVLGTPEAQVAGNTELVRSVVTVRRLKKAPGSTTERVLDIMRVPVVAIKHQQAILEQRYRPGQPILLIGHLETRPLREHVPGEDDRPVDVVIDQFLAREGPLRGTGARPDEGREGAEGLAAAFLVGFVYREPTLSTTGHGVQIARCAIAIPRSRVDPDNPARPLHVITRIPILAFNKNARDMVARYIPGQAMVIEGHLREHVRPSRLAAEETPIVPVMVNTFALAKDLQVAGAPLRRPARPGPTRRSAYPMRPESPHPEVPAC